MKTLTVALVATVLSAGTVFAACGSMAERTPPVQTTAETAPIILPSQAGS